MSNIKIGVRMHSPTERNVEQKPQSTVTAENANNSVNESLTPSLNFAVFDPEHLNKNIYSSSVDPVVKLCLDGNDGTVLIYGRTSSGENGSMVGTDENPDIHLLAVERLLKRTNVSPNIKLKIRVGYIEIYKEKVYDLLNERKKVIVDSTGQFDIKEFQVDSIEETTSVFLQGSKKRTPSSIDKNKFSSHAIFQISIASEDRAKRTTKTSYLRFVHVADSELFRPSEYDLKNTDDNSKSLLWLNFVVDELKEGKNDIKSNSNSILTQILQESLRSDSNTAIICSTCEDAVDETLSTLDYFGSERKRGLEMDEYSNSSLGSKRMKTMSLHSSASTPMEESFCSLFDGSTFDVEPESEESEHLRIDNLVLKTKVFAAKFKFALRKLKHDQKVSNKMRTEFENLKIQLNEKDTELESLRKECQDLKLEQEKSLSLLQNENDESKRVSNHRKNHNAEPMSRSRNLTENRTGAAKHSRTMSISNHYAGCIIGKQRVILNSIKSETGAEIDISVRDGSAIRVVTITGPTPRAVNSAEEKIRFKINREIALRENDHIHVNTFI